MNPENRKYDELRNKIYEIIFEADTKEGKLFDVILLITILASVLAVMLETIPSIHDEYGKLLLNLEWIFTIFFTIEYIVRIYSVRRKRGYIFSFFGIVDLLAILPLYLSLIFVGTQSLAIIRGLRLLRVFRIFKLAHFMDQGKLLVMALKASRAKIIVFLIFVLIMTSIFGSIMYLIESPTNDGFDSIPRSVYWAIVTLTTVGYGNIAPITPFGQFLASFIMITGYAIIAVPTGIVTAEVMKDRSLAKKESTQCCPYCTQEGHTEDAVYCKFCGELLNPQDL